MKRLITLLIVIGLAASVLAQAPQKMSYQAVIRDNLDHLVNSQVVGLKITILQGSSTGTPVYTETQTPTTNANGLITIEFGGGAGFSSINWANGPYYLKTETDPAGGTNYTIAGTSQLLSVPYALYSKISESDATAVKLTGDQTIGGNKTFTGTTTVQTPVNASDAVTKAYVDALLAQINTLERQPGIVKDYDGNLYTTIKIGDLVWMGENLKTTHYKDGEVITNVTDDTEWSGLSTPGYCWYNNDASIYGATYGALYNWYAVNTGKICPTGWHVPSDVEWTKLTTYLGGESAAGGKLKETGFTHWLNPNLGATNESSFTALPGAYRHLNGTFANIGKNGDWWLATEYDATTALGRYLYYDVSGADGYNLNKKYGFSVRCVRD
jgi:uncharacterized protein (TIGR02145 family)